MVRFGVYLDHHAVPEWRDRYVAYTRLASLLKPVAAAWKVRRAALTSSAASTASSIFDSTEPLVSIDNVSESADGGDERVSLLAQTTVPFSHTSTLLRRRAASTAASVATPVNALLHSAMETARTALPRRTAAISHDNIASDRASSSQAAIAAALPLAELRALVAPALLAHAEDSAFFDALHHELDKVETFFESEVEFFRLQRDTLLEQVAAMKANQGAAAAASIDFVRVAAELKTSTKQLHHGLSLLLNFRVLNHAAVDKLCARYGIITGWTAATETIVPRVAAMPFYSSALLPQLVADVEQTFEECFSGSSSGGGNDDGDSADDSLYVRPPQLERSTVFYVGFCIGLVLTMVALIVVFLTINPDTKSTDKFHNAFPIFRGVALFSLQIWAWGIVLYFCQSHHINTVFILDADPRTALSFEHVFFLAANFTLLIFVAVLTWLALIAYTSGLASGWTHFAAFVIVVVIAAWPLKHFYAPTRMFLWETLRDIVISPFSAVLFHHFFIADILTSLVRALQDIAYAMCFYTTGEFFTELPEHRCRDSYTLVIFTYLLALLPYYWRLMQCLRRYRDDSKQSTQLWNALKYATAMIATIVNLIARNEEAGASKTAAIYVWVALALLSSLYSFWWDLVKDWGMFNATSSEYPLREHRLFPKFVYYTAIPLDLVLRLTWILTISPHAFGFLSDGFPLPYFLFLISALEVLRRNIWAVLRLEHEHLVNSESYRVVNVVPLFFHQDSSRLVPTSAKHAPPSSSTSGADVISTGVLGTIDDAAALSSSTPVRSLLTLTAAQRREIVSRARRDLERQARDDGLTAHDSESDADFE